MVEKMDNVCHGASFQNGGVINVESISPVNSYMSLFGTVKSSIKSYVTGTPTNSMVRPAAIFEPNLALWVKYFILNSTQDKILYHSEGTITNYFSRLFLHKHKVLQSSFFTVIFFGFIKDIFLKLF